MKNLLIVSILVLLLTGCGQTADTNNTADTTDTNSTTTTDSASMPDNLITCDPVFFERGEDGIAPDCSTFGGNSVCSFHTKEQDGNTKNETVQYDNACAACRFYGETNVRELGSAVFTHHGYLEQGCDGIIWE